jgi:hypothetical protein
LQLCVALAHNAKRSENQVVEHYQERHSCSVCNRVLIVDIFSWGVSHQKITAVTCEECAKQAGGNLLGDKKETVEHNPAC